MLLNKFIVSADHNLLIYNNEWESIIEYKQYNCPSMQEPLQSSYPSLKPKVIDWLNNTVGLQNKKWAVHPPSFDKDGFVGSKVVFEIFFLLKRDAILFKLTWL